ncbi:hypothetical protein [Streptomyces sp. TRM64462]|uniref:hypothetical protein n=1 Tax=Streptomyces sp. TRM64462 TaxID=2741726 RepID=UPI001585E63D|nr:hypothetical protein [Streptomyces sp. TRM64462]
MSQSCRRRAVRLGTAGLAAGAALALCGSAGTAHAGAAGFYVSLQTHSNVREAATTNSKLILNTGSVKDRYYMDGLCYVHGQYVKAGSYGTDVWYKGHVVDGVDVMQPTRHNVWVWGGNVNIGKDPSDSVDRC